MLDAEWSRLKARLDADPADNDARRRLRAHEERCEMSFTQLPAIDIAHELIGVFNYIQAGEWLPKIVCPEGGVLFALERHKTSRDIAIGLNCDKFFVAKGLIAIPDAGLVRIRKA